MRITLGRLRRLIREDLLREGIAYDMPIDVVREKWPDQFEDAIEFVMCVMGVSDNAARGHVVNNWVFDTLEHEGQTYLLARDEATGESLGYQQKMGGWYNRLEASKNSQCRQTGSRRGSESGVRRKVDREAETIPPPGRRKTGTAVSGQAPQKSDRMKRLEKAAFSGGYDI